MKFFGEVENDIYIEDLVLISKINWIFYVESKKVFIDWDDYFWRKKKFFDYFFYDLISNCLVFIWFMLVFLLLLNWEWLVVLF